MKNSCKSYIFQEPRSCYFTSIATRTSRYIIHLVNRTVLICKLPDLRAKDISYGSFLKTSTWPLASKDIWSKSLGIWHQDTTSQLANSPEHLILRSNWQLRPYDNLELLLFRSNAYGNFYLALRVSRDCGDLTIYLEGLRNGVDVVRLLA